MIAASACVLLLVIWTLLAYFVIPSPIGDPLFAWLRRQWLVEGIAVLGALGTIGISLAHRRNTALPRLLWWIPWGTWMLWASWSATYSIDQDATLRSWLAFTSYGLVAYTMARLIDSPHAVGMWVRFLVGVSVAVSLEGLFQYFGAFSATLPVMERLQEAGHLHLQGWNEGVVKDFLQRKRIFSVFGWPNLFAGFLLLMIPLAAALSLQSRKGLGRVGWALAGGLLGVCLVLTLSMGGWIAAVLTGSIAWWLTCQPPIHPARTAARPGTALTRAVVVGIVLCAAVSIGSFIVAKRARPIILSSVSSRVFYVQGAWNLIRAQPVLGTGLGTFGLAYHATKPLEAEEGQHTALHAHNTLLEVASELGLIGLLLFCAFLVSVWHLIARSVRAGVPSPLRTLSRGLAFGVLGFFIHSLLEQTFFEAVTAPFWWIALGVMTGASTVAERETALRASRTTRVTGLWLPCALAGLGMIVSVRLAMADGWAARAALADSANRVQAASRGFDEALRWNPLASRYPLERAERLLHRAADTPPEGAEPLLKEAQQSLERVVQLSPWLGYAWLRLGLVRWQVGETDRAIEAVREAVRRDPNSRAAAAHAVQMLLAAGRFSEVLEAAQRVQRLEPSNPQGWFWAAQGWQGLGQLARVERAYEALLSRFPEHYPSWYNLAALRRQAGRFDDAAAAYEAFLRVAPEHDVGPRGAAEVFLEEHHSPRDAPREDAPIFGE